MILGAIKKKIIQKKINNALKSKKTVANNEKITTIGVIVNVDEFKDFAALRAYFKNLIPSIKIEIITFENDEKKPRNTDTKIVTEKDVNWKGKINNEHLQTFVQSKFDVLVSYYKQDILELDLVTALSQSNFKIGLSNKNLHLFDLIIDIEPIEIEIFKNELKKYLTVLNKI